MEKKPSFVYVNNSTSKIKQITISLPKIIFGIIFLVLLVSIALKISADIMVNTNYNSKISQLLKKNSLLEQEVNKMSEMIIYLRNQVDQIEEIDDKLREFIDVDPIDSDVREVGIGGSDVVSFSALDLDDPRLNTTIINNQATLAKLEREIKLETESFKKLLSIVEVKEDSLKYLPAIKPVPSGRLTAGFGRRRHPILKRIIPHYGIDLGANRGTPILAAANGYVTFTGKNGGYGLFVTIDHKYGFETKYGHLQKIYVRRGQYVKRGDKIGEVGNSGLSTAPHLHYEIHYKNKPVNPKDFYFNEITFE